MQFDNQTTRNVADIVARILAGESVKQEPKMLEEELVGNQHKIDANKNKKIDSHDFKLLRAQKDKEKANSQKFGKGVKEEAEQIDELLKQDTKNSFIASKMKDDDSTKSKAEFTNKTKGFTLDAAKSSLKNKIKSTHHGKYDIDNTSSFDHAVKKYHKAKMAGHINEETELDEAMFPGTKEYEKKYGQSPQQKLKKVGDTEKTAQGEMKKTEKGVMHTRRKFTEMIESYAEGGLKYIASLVQEEPDNEQFTKEADDVKRKATQKKSPEDEARVAKASVQAVKQEETEIQVINADIANGVDQVDIEERSLTEPEMKKKEEMVKGMKKKMPGFKERYGDRAKEVMYATATARAKGE